MKPLILLVLSLLPFASLANTDRVLTLALGAEPETGFDPIYGWGKYNRPLFQSTLIKRDNALELVSDLALQWRLSEDRLSWLVDLRDGVKFSDGSALTAADVKFSFDTAKNSASLHDLTNLERVEILDDHSLRFYLKQADITFIDNLVNLAIVPKASYNAAYGLNPIGSGPLAFVRWDRNQQLIMQPNPYYYGQKPAFSKIVVTFSDEDSRYARLRSGQLDLAAIAPRYAKILPPGYKLWSIDSVDNRGIAWPMVPVQGSGIGNDVTSDSVIRQAIDMAVERQILVQQLLDGFATPAYSIADGLPWGPQQISSNKPDLDAAKRLLEQNGWQLKAGLRHKGDTVASMTLYYLAGDTVRQQLALAVAQMVKPLGIEIKPVGKSWEAIYLQMHSQPVLLGFGSHSATEVRAVYHSASRGKGYFNSGYYSNPQVDKALDNAQAAASWSESLPFWQQAQTLIAADRPWTWLVNLQHLYAANECLDLSEPGIEAHGHGWPLANNIEQWRWQCPDR
ncbi:ABC transporter substrate-binding protein [Shewanella sp. MBTL60-007]|uniref:ABC transporter substrate-binding protein n=1 Tax=Shewanella sp. MBTL60-007 TaxID=2815911 RepID=UPI001C8002F8|nr:ABC transporter substrate-binding protein [Shewanella sp. MBTL60-007]